MKEKENMLKASPEQITAAQEYLKAATKLIDEKNNEQVVRDHFTSYLRIIFPAIPTWITEHVVGGEAALKTRKGEKETTGFVDNLIGLTPIEYEGDLRNSAKFNEGYGQVQKYCASLINGGNDPTQIIGILSDTVRWHAYRVASIDVPAGKVEAEHVHLEELESLDASSSTEIDAQRFVDFLIKFIQRLGSRPLNAISITRDLGFDSTFCTRHIATLSEVVNVSFDENETYAELIKQLWLDFVSPASTADSFDIDEYVREFYILSLAKLICANALEKNALLSEKQELKDILSGTFFKARGLENFIEYDYFGWLNSPKGIDEQVIKVAHEIQQDLRAYSFENISDEDIFGQLMAQLAERSQRILLGQEWTPTWLAREIVTNTISKLPENVPPHFIDMCCGSGAMIIEIVKQTKDRLSKVDIPNEQKIKTLERSAVGFDIDPLAVMLARISWVLSARDWLMPLGTYRVTIPIYHADSLFATSPFSEGDGGKVILKLADYEVEIPSFLISATWQDVFDYLVDRAYVLAVETDPSKVDTSVLIDSAIKIAPDEVTEILKAELKKFAEELIEKIHTLHTEGRNGIWAFVLRNNYRPALVAGQFNGLVSNPPWLALSKIADNPYKEALTNIANSLGIKPQGSSFLHLDMSTVFLLRSVDKYLEEGAYIGCVVPETVLNGHQHEPFRNRAYQSVKAPVSFDVTELWRVDEKVFKNRAAVIFGTKNDSDIRSNISGAYLLQDGSKTPLNFKEVTLGSHTVWTDKIVDDTGDVFHPADFEQGADIMPRRLFFHEHKESKRSGMVELSPIEQGSSSLSYLVNDAKQCKDFRISTPCVVPNDFIFDVLISKLLSPFMVASPVKAFLPLKKNDSNEWISVTDTDLQIEVNNESALRAFRSIATEITKLDKKPGASGINNIWERVNYRNKIGKQNFGSDGYLVFTGAGGSDVCAGMISLSEVDSEKLIIDQTLYWAWIPDYKEALYLTGMLNSNAVNEAIKAFQPRGQQGERHVHELAFNVTQPFDASNSLHLAVVETTEKLIMEYHEALTDEDWAQWLGPEKSLARRRSKLRTLISTLPSYADYSEACNATYKI